MLLRGNTSDEELIAQLAHQLELALSILCDCRWGTWRGNSKRALEAAQERLGA